MSFKNRVLHSLWLGAISLLISPFQIQDAKASANASVFIPSSAFGDYCCALISLSKEGGQSLTKQNYARQGEITAAQ
jgi:hypothetical protein